MKKYFIALLVGFVLLLASCTQEVLVEKFVEEKKSYGFDLEFYTVTNNLEFTHYALVYSENVLYGNSTFFIYYPDGSYKRFDNATVGAIERNIGNIKSIVINDVKYIAK